MLSAENRAGSGWLTPEAVTLAILTLSGGSDVDSVTMSAMVTVRLLRVERDLAVGSPSRRLREFARRPRRPHP